jgi:flagellar biosynthesis/type III secretory pathway protein FliH
MTTSKQPPGGPSNYARFIPREELKGFAAWNPTSLEDPAVHKAAPGESPAGGGVHKAPFAVRAAMGEAEVDSPLNHAPTKPTAAAPAKAPAKPATSAATQAAPPKPVAAPAPAVEPEPAPKVDVDALVKESRQAGYQDGYRDGLAALESYKQTQSAQMAAFMSDQVGNLVSDLHQRLELLEAQLSGRIAGVALELARQVVRSEISMRPELVVTVAEDALGTLLSSARDVVLRLNPDDLALAHGSLEEQLRARGARVMGDPHVAQGGCVVESDIAVVDASVDARWQRAAAAMGIDMPWDEQAGVVHSAALPNEGPTDWGDEPVGGVADRSGDTE